MSQVRVSEIFFSLWLSDKFKKMTSLYIFYCNYAREVQFDLLSFKANVTELPSEYTKVT